MCAFRPLVVCIFDRHEKNSVKYPFSCLVRTNLPNLNRAVIFREDHHACWLAGDNASVLYLFLRFRWGKSADTAGVSLIHAVL